MSKKDGYLERHKYAAEYLKKRYDLNLPEDVQISVVYKVGQRKVMILVAGAEGDGLQAIRAANYDDLSGTDVIHFHDMVTGVTVEFYKSELQAFLDAQFLVWKSDKIGKGMTNTRLLIRVNGDRLVITSSKRPQLLFDYAGLNRELVSGDTPPENNYLLDCFSMEFQKRHLTRRV